MLIESFKTREQALERIKELHPGLSIQAEVGHDPEDPNADEHGYVWVIAVRLHKNADKLYLCTGGYLR